MCTGATGAGAKNNQTNVENVFKPENKGSEGIQLLPSHFKANLNHTDAILSVLGCTNTLVMRTLEV